MGVPEVFVLLVTLALYALAIFVLYWVVKKAVKNGILEAREKIREAGDRPPLQGQ